MTDQDYSVTLPRAVVEQALEALLHCRPARGVKDALSIRNETIDVLRYALTQPQEFNQADFEIATGRTKTFSSAEALIADLMSDDEATDAPIAAGECADAWMAGYRAAIAKAEQAEQEGIHSCGYHCDKPACIKAQRDELRARLEQAEQRQEAWQPCEFDEIADASKNLAPWLSAALDDPLACDEFKKAVDWWFQSGADKIRELPKDRQEAWQGLSDEEANEIWENNDTDWESIKRVEAKLREKNAKPAEQQPVLYVMQSDVQTISEYETPQLIHASNRPMGEVTQPLYTAPPTQQALREAADPVARAMSVVADEFAHKLALDLECVLSDCQSSRWWDTAMNTLSAYRSAMNKIHEKVSPTFMGEPCIDAALRGEGGKG